MSEFAANARLLIEELSKFYEEISQLLQAADAVFAEHSWTPMKATITGSNAVGQPEGWLARVMHRFYYPEEEALKNLLPFVSVIIADPEGTDRPSEPVFTAGCFEYDPEKWGYYKFSRVFCELESATTDGRLVFEERENFSHNVGHWKRVVLVAVPLESIENVERLRSVLAPLLGVINSDDPFAASNSR